MLTYILYFFLEISFTFQLNICSCHMHLVRNSWIYLWTVILSWLHSQKNIYEGLSSPSEISALLHLVLSYFTWITKFLFFSNYKLKGVKLLEQRCRRQFDSTEWHLPWMNWEFIFEYHSNKIPQLHYNSLD